MLRKHALLLGVVGSLVMAVLAYFWVMAMMDSLYAFRSPLATQPPQPDAALGNPATRRVVFVLIDGLRNDTANNAQVMPFLAGLRTQGAATTVHSHPPSFSAPSYTVLFSGAWPELSDGPALNLTYDEYWAWTQDNLFSAVHRAGGATAVSGYYWFEKLIPQEAVTDHFFTPGDDATADRQVTDAALPWLKTDRHQLVLIHLDQVDYAGHHEGGAVSQNWAAAARRADDLLREIAAPLDLSQDTLLVTSDHGHIDAGGHGGQDAIVLLEPFVLVGAGVRPGQYTDIHQTDIAPTVAALLGTTLPATAQGHAIREMLTLTPEDQHRLTRAEALQQAQLAAAYGAAIGRPISAGEGADAIATQQAMDATRDARLMGERWPRIIVALVAGAALLIAVWRTRSRVTPRLLNATLVYLVVFNVRYALLDGGTYSLSSVTGQTELILYMAANTFLALIAGWLVLAATVGLLGRPLVQAVRLTLGWTLLTAAIAALPLALSFAWNGPVVGWSMPEFNLFFLAFLALLQALFIGAIGLFLAGVTALGAWLTSWARRRPATAQATSFTEETT